MPEYYASDLRQRIEIYPLTRVSDGGGGFTEVYGPASPPIKLPAMVKPRTAGERWYAGQTASSTQFLVVVRHRTGILASMRIAYGSRILELVGPPIDVDERHEWLELECREALSG